MGPRDREGEGRMKATFEKLFGAYGKTPTGGASEAYVEALADVPLAAIDQAVRVLVRSARFLPTPAEVRAEALKFIPAAPPEPDKSAPLERPYDIPLPTGKTIHVTREWFDDCDVCRDSGWRPFWCPGGIDAENPTYDSRTMPCGRKHRDLDGGHEFVAQCRCYHTNPTIQRRIGKRSTAA